MLRQKWFWYSVFCLGCWGPWAIVSKLGAREIPAPSMQFLFTLGGIPVALGMLAARRFRMEKSPRGIACGLANGLLSATGTLALFAAFRTPGNTAVITTTTALYPMVTVVLAAILLREHLNRRQIVGLAFAAAAIIMFSQ